MDDRDIVERLRVYVRNNGVVVGYRAACEVMATAAAEIERLRHDLTRAREAQGELLEELTTVKRTRASILEEYALCRKLLLERAGDLSTAQAELAEARKVIAVCRQTIIEQAAARADPDMPLLTPEVLEQLQSDAEANYACAETRQERVAAHGLSLLCDWQDRARANVDARPTSTP